MTRKAVSRRAGEAADRSVRLCVALRRRARRRRKPKRCWRISKGTSPAAVYSDTQGSDEEALCAARAAASPARRPPAERQDAHGRCREPGDESRRAVSRDGPSWLHRRRHPRVASPVRRCCRCYDNVRRAPVARRAARRESERPDVAAHRRHNDTGLPASMRHRSSISTRRFDALVPRDARSKRSRGGFTFTEGPLWRPSGVLWFSDVVGNVVRQWSPDGQGRPSCCARAATTATAFLPAGSSGRTA